MSIKHFTQAGRLILVGLIFASCANAAVESSNNGRLTNKVEIKVIETYEVADDFLLPATIEAWQEALVSFEASGRIKRRYKQIGDYVRSGDLLLELDQTIAAAALKKAEAQYNFNASNLERMQNLFNENAISRQELDQAGLSYEVAQADFNLAKQNLANTRIVSPINGRVEEIMLDIGELANPGMAAARVLDASQLKIFAEVPEKDIAYIRGGMKVKIFPDDIEGQTVDGQVLHIHTKADPVSRTYRVEFKMNRDSASRFSLYSGMIVRVRIVRELLKNAITVPIFSLVKEEEGYSLYREENGRAKQVKPVLGRTLGDEVVIQQGLRAGDRLIVKGQHYLTDDLEVEIDN